MRSIPGKIKVVSMIEEGEVNINSNFLSVNSIIYSSLELRDEVLQCERHFLSPNVFIIEIKIQLQPNGFPSKQICKHYGGERINRV